MQQRNCSIELLRVMACVAVVWLHVAAPLVITEPGLRSPTWWMANLADSISRWGVPIFVMISGSLLLSRAASEPLLAFYRRRLGRVMIPLVFWTLFYVAFDSGLLRHYGFLAALDSIVRGIPYYHLWYLYMLLGLYLVAPFLGLFVRGASRRLMLAAILVSFCMAFLSDLVTTLRDAQPSSFLDIWPLYVGYFLAGHYVSHMPLPTVNKKLVGSIAFACGIAIAGLTGLLLPSVGSKAWRGMYSYLNPLVVVMSGCIFWMARASNWNVLSKSSFLRWQVRHVAPLTLGIFLIHPAWLRILDHFQVRPYLFGPLLGIPLVTLIAFSLSLATAWFVSRVPLVRETIGINSGATRTELFNLAQDSTASQAVVEDR